MSGRKSGEVAGVLAQGEKVRQMGDAIYTEQIERDIKKALESMEKAKDERKKALTYETNLTSEAEEMFSSEGKEKETRFASLKKKISDISFRESDVTAIRHELKKLDNALIAADREGEAIREAIKGKRNGWYCDDEYRRAQNLVKEYGKLRDQRIGLSKRAEQLRMDASREQNAIVADAQTMQTIKEAIENMNETAKKRQESNAMRESLNKLMNQLPVKEAEKFFADEYAVLKSEIEDAVHLSDDALIADFRDKFAKIAAFEARLKERINLWRQQKADAEESLRHIEERADFSLIGPVEYFNKKERGEKTSLFDYLKQYANQDLSGAYEKSLKEAKGLIRQEKFVESMEVLQKAADLVNDARDKATALQESMLKKTELAGAIQRVMKDMKYNVKTRIIGDNPDNGFRVTCNVGDEIIDFDRIDIDNDGKVIVNIDHREAIGGTCRNSWPKIAERLQDEGIPVTNVTLSDGHSILRNKIRIGGQGEESRVRSH